VSPGEASSIIVINPNMSAFTTHNDNEGSGDPLVDMDAIKSILALVQVKGALKVPPSLEIASFIYFPFCKHINFTLRKTMRW